MHAKHRSIVAAALLASSLLTAAPANAQIPVIDPTAIARIREVVSTGTKMLGKAQEQLGQITQMRNTIGQGGMGALTSIMGAAKIDFSGAQGMLSTVKSLSDPANQISNLASQLKLPGEAGLNLPQIKTLDQGRQAAGQLFFFNSSEPLTQANVADLRERRSIVLRETAVSAYGAATALKSELEGSRQTADALQAQAKSSPDLRTDVQVSTATLLAMYAELQKQTSMTAQMLELESARVLAGDSTGRRAPQQAGQ